MLALSLLLFELMVLSDNPTPMNLKHLKASAWQYEQFPHQKPIIRLWGPQNDVAKGDASRNRDNAKTGVWHLAPFPANINPVGRYTLLREIKLSGLLDLKLYWLHRVLNRLKGNHIKETFFSVIKLWSNPFRFLAFSLGLRMASHTMWCNQNLPICPVKG